MTQYQTPCCGTHEIPEGYDAVLVCPACKQNVGVFDSEALTVPINPKMFQSLCLPHQFPRPDIPWAITDRQPEQWKYVQCGMYGCPNLLFVDKLTGKHVTEIMTSEGPFTIGSGSAPKVIPQEEINHARTDKVCEMWGPRVDEVIEEGKLNDIDTLGTEIEYLCKHCGNSYKHDSSRSRHEQGCKEKNATNPEA